MTQDPRIREDIENAVWEKPVTEAFRSTQMGYLVYSWPRDLAQMLSSDPDIPARTAAMVEYTNRGEWRKAAELARLLHERYSFFKAELIDVYGEKKTARLLSEPLESLPTVIYK